jgi:hypothetical protein
VFLGLTNFLSIEKVLVQYFSIILIYAEKEKSVPDPATTWIKADSKR